MSKLAKFPSLIIGAAFSMALALPAMAQDTAAADDQADMAMAEVDADTVLATVNGETITLGHVISARFSLPQEYQALPNEVLFDGLIEQLIQQTVLGQAMGEMTRRAQVQLDNERRAIAAAEKLDTVISDAADEAMITAAYEEAYADAEPVSEWNASHILVETEEEVLAIIEELNGGADFAAMAREKSTGPTGPNGGELGWFSPGMMVEEFEEAVSTMEVGAISGPVQTQFGWHVVKLNDAREKGAPALEEVRGDIVEQLENDAVEKALEALLAAASIERTDVTGIDPNVLGDPALLD